MRISAVQWTIGIIACISLLGKNANLLAQSLEEKHDTWNDFVSASPWVFLGDSNTFAGGYVAILDAWLDSPELKGSCPKLLNLGVASETASGESEVDHPFMRPCVHARLEKVLEMTRPSVVFICYGMNDGIYEPFNEKNFAAYRAGMIRLAARIKSTGARLVCLTPPIFEPGPLAAQGKLGPSPNGRYAYFAPAPDYDLVLEKQAAWCLTNEIEADLVIDVHSMMEAEAKRARASNPEFAFTRDGVHFGPQAHRLIANAVLESLGAPDAVLAKFPSDEAVELARKRMLLLRDAYLSATGKNRPGLPAGYPIWYAERAAAKLRQ